MENVAEFDNDINMHRSNPWAWIYPAIDAIFSVYNLLGTRKKCLFLESKVKFRDVEIPQMGLLYPRLPQHSQVLNLSLLGSHLKLVYWIESDDLCHSAKPFRPRVSK